MNTILRYTFVAVFFSQIGFCQSKLNTFLKPSDTIHVQRQKTVLVCQAVVATGTLLALNQLWYASYPKSNFHFIDDTAEWLQMDKVGHVFSSYQLGSFSAQMLQWGGASKKKQLLYGAGLGFAFMTAIEVMDGHSAEWGASIGDIVANAAGTGLYVSQELLWKEQRMLPKFSFHTSPYAQYRPAVLGKSISEQIIKDYNGQTYWLSINLYSFAKNSKIPKWFNIALGYGAEGMLSGRTNSVFNSQNNPQRYRQFYVSLDADLTKIKTKSAFLKTVFSVVNSIKIPAPTIEFSSLNGIKYHFVYF